MTEYDFWGARYRVRRLPAVEQWALLRHLAPILPAIAGMDEGLRRQNSLTDIAALLAPLHGASDEDLAAVFAFALKATEVMQEGEWAAIDEPPAMGVLMQIVASMVSVNLGPLLAMERVSFRSEAEAPGFVPVELPNGRGWLMRPVFSGMCRMESLLDGTLGLEHVAEMNDVLAINDENQARAQKAAARAANKSR